MKYKHVYLNLFSIDFPITAITSIIHRITGLLLFFFIPFFLYFFNLSIESKSSFTLALDLFNLIYIKFFLYFFFLIFNYHMFNEIKTYYNRLWLF